MFVHGSAVDVPIGPIVAGVEGGEVLPLGEGGGPTAHLHNKTITSPNKVYASYNETYYTQFWEVVEHRVGHSVLFRSERSLLFCSFAFFFSFWQLMKPKRTMRSFPFFS